MTRSAAILLAAAMLVSAGLAPVADACTNFLITKGASTDGSTFISYSADSHELYGELYLTPAGIHPAGEMRDIVEWDTAKLLGRIPQAPVTYWVVGNMNEHQVSVGETTFGGREELAEGPAGIVDYGSLMYIALERASTAREAIQVMTSLAEEYGYASEGETFSIADPNEAWIMDMIGKGKGKKGAVWVARRVPDGYVSGHANQARIRRFPLNDPANCLYAKDVISFARDMKWFSGKDEEFSFVDTYAPSNFEAQRFCESRVWCMFNRIAPSQKIPVDYAMGKPGAEPIPLWVKPDHKISVRDVQRLMRDHFEGTPMDMTQDVGAGPFKAPYRWRPMTWEVDGGKYVHERAVSTQQTGFSFVSQMRSWLPDPIGGVLWFGVDDTYFTVYVPMYCGIQAVPRPYAVGTGNFRSFSWDSAFWVFNFVANWSYTRYSDMVVDVQNVQNELEGKFAAEQAEIDKTALKLNESGPQLAREFLTRYSVAEGEAVVKRWRALGEFLLWKYMDGNVKVQTVREFKVEHPVASEEWYRNIVKNHGEVIKNLTPPPTPTPAPSPTPKP
jgi:dipeptidase